MRSVINERETGLYFYRHSRHLRTPTDVVSERDVEWDHGCCVLCENKNVRVFTAAAHGGSTAANPHDSCSRISSAL